MSIEPLDVVLKRLAEQARPIHELFKRLDAQSQPIAHALKRLDQQVHSLWEEINLSGTTVRSILQDLRSFDAPETVNAGVDRAVFPMLDYYTPPAIEQISASANRIHELSDKVERLADDLRELRALLYVDVPEDDTTPTTTVH
jgi:hypothetical protein